MNLSVFCRVAIILIVLIKRSIINAIIPYGVFCQRVRCFGPIVTSILTNVLPKRVARATPDRSNCTAYLYYSSVALLFFNDTVRLLVLKYHYANIYFVNKQIFLITIGTPTQVVCLSLRGCVYVLNVRCTVFLFFCYVLIARFLF